MPSYFFKWSYITLFICSFHLPLEGLLDLFGVSGSPAPFVINTAVAGQQPTPSVDTSTTFSILATLSNTVVGSLNAPLPTSVTLQVQLTAPALLGGGTSTGLTTLSVTNKSLLVGINLTALSLGNPVTYRLSATVNAAPITNDTRTITYTLQ